MENFNLRSVSMNKSRLLTACLFCLGLVSLTMAWHGGHGGGYYGGYHGYHGYYGHPWGGFYIGSIWFDSPTIVSDGVPYYYANGYYYVPQGNTYVIVEPPAPAPAAVTPAPVTPAPIEQPKVVASLNTTKEIQSDTVTINVPNSKGGYVPVKLIKKDKGYVGPQGEFYPGNPTVAELKTLYGK